MHPLNRYFHPVLASASLTTRPVRVTVAGHALALFRDPEGHAAALDDACPHRLAPLSRGRVRPDGRLACPYHGWHFDRTGAGVCPTIPDLPRCRTRGWQVVERYDAIWVAGPDVPMTLFPTMAFDGWEYAGHAITPFPAPLHVAMDNFNENEHTPWLHGMLGWTEADAPKVTFFSKNLPDQTNIHYEAPQRPSPWLPFLGVKAGDTFVNDWQTRFDPVRSVYTLAWRDPVTGAPRPLATRFVIFLVPESDTVTLYQTFLYVKIAPGFYRTIAPVVKRVAMYLGRSEIARDAAFIPAVADTPLSLKGMRLTRFDHPLIHNRTLLRTLYWGVSPVDAE